MYKRTTINNLSVIEIDNFLSKEEIQTILESRIESFEPAIGHYPKYYRNNDRLEEDNPSLSSMLFKRLKSLNILKKEITDDIIAVNERIRYYLRSIKTVFIILMLFQNLNLRFYYI